MPIDPDARKARPAYRIVECMNDAVLRSGSPEKADGDITTPEMLIEGVFVAEYQGARSPCPGLAQDLT
jgi:hypothetical protein